MLLADGFDDAFIGTTTTHEGVEIAVYSVDRCIEVLHKDGMTREEALEWLEHNTLCAHVGPTTPMFIYEESLESVLVRMEEVEE